jgi:hypothetical protein
VKHKKKGLLAVAFALVFVGAIPAAASGPPSWAPPTNLSGATTQPAWPQLAASPDGTLTAVWQQYDGSNNIIQSARSINGGSSWSSPVNLSPASQNAVFAQVVAAANGSLTAIWNNFSGGNNIIQSSHSTDGTSWSTSVNLASFMSGEAGGPQIVAAAGSALTAVWPGAGNVIQSSNSADGTTWTAPVSVSAAGGAASSPQLAAASSGALTAVWTRFDGSKNVIQSSNSVNGGLSWTAPVDISDALGNAFNPQIAVASNGSATAVWYRFDGSNNVIQSSHSADGIAWAVPANLSTAGGDAESPHVVTASDGSYTAVWNRFDGSNTIVQSSHSLGGTTWTAPTNLSGVGQNALGEQIVGASDGILTAVWNRFDGSHTLIQTSHSLDGITWDAPVNLSLDGTSDSAQLASASDGSLTAIWQNTLSGSIVVQSASAPIAPVIPPAVVGSVVPRVAPQKTPAPATPTPSPDAAVPVASTLEIVFGFTVGEHANDGQLFVTGDGFVPENVVTVTLHSTPTMLGTFTTSSTGSFDKTLVLPAQLDEGAHHIEVTYTEADGRETTKSWYFVVDASGITTNIQTQPTARPPSWAQTTDHGSAGPGQVTIRGVTYDRYLPSLHPAASVDTMVSSLVLLALLGGVGAASAFAGGSMAMAGSAVATRRARGAASSPRDEFHKSASLASAKVKHLKFKQEAIERGDRSPTWAWAGVQRLDSLSMTLPERLNRFSPLLARVANDGAYLRAMVGPLWLISSVMGVALGVLSTASTGGAAVPPALGLMIAIVVLSTFDVLGGLLAASTFTIGVIVLGGLTTFAEVRTLLGIVVIFFTVALAASAARPLRRVPAKSAGDWFDRIADVAIAALIGTWAVTKMAGALPALSGLDLPIAGSALTIALCAGVAIVVRYVLETLATYLYPLRLAAVAPPRIGFPSPLQQIASAVLKTVLFVFVAIAYLGNVWPLWVGAALFLIPSIITAFQVKLPNVPRLVKLIPGGVVKIVLMLCIGKLLGGWLASTIHNPQDLMGQAFVILSIPSLILGFVGFFGRDGDHWRLNWPFRIGGTVVLAVGVLLVLGIIRIS